MFTGQDTNLVEQFNAQVDTAYTEILTQLEREDADLAVLSKQYQQVSLQDYFQSPLGVRVREILLSRRGGES